jgi:hypothetical protein
MPSELWEACLPYMQRWGSTLGKKYGQENVTLGKGFWSQTPEQWKETQKRETQKRGGQEAGRIAFKNKTGIHTEDQNLRRDWASKGGSKIKGKVWWNDGINNKRSVEQPGEGWVRGVITNRWSNK